MKKEQYSPLCSPVVFDLIGLVLLFAFIFLSPPLGSDPGTGWHLKTGEWIAQNKTFIYNDPFLWTTDNKPWVSNQWLADLIFWCVYSTGGWDSLAILCFVLPLVSILYFQGRIFWSLWSSPSGSPSIRNLIAKLFPISVISISLLVAWVQWIIRPVIFSFTLFGLVFFLTWKDLESQKKSKIFYLYTALIFIFWANVHSAFPLGFMIFGSVLFSALIKRDYQKAKRYLLALLLAITATVVNPYGFRLHQNIFELLGSSYFMKLNAEWHSPDFSEILFMPVLVAAALLIFLILLRKGRSPLWINLILAALFFMSFKSVRYISFLGVVLPVSFAYLLGKVSQTPEVRAQKYRPYLCGSISLMLIIYSFSADFGEPQKFASEILNKQKLWDRVALVCKQTNGKLLNHPNYGGAVTFNLYPRCRASMDDRNELNGEVAYRDFLSSINQPDYKKLDATLYYLIPCRSAVVRANGMLITSELVIEDFGDECLLRRSETEKGRE